MDNDTDAQLDSNPSTEKPSWLGSLFSGGQAVNKTTVLVALIIGTASVARAFSCGRRTIDAISVEVESGIHGMVYKMDKKSGVPWALAGAQSYRHEDETTK